MRVLFYTYIFLYISISLILSFSHVSLITSKILHGLSILIMGLIVLAPIAVVINPKIIKSHSSDSKYLNMCFIAGMFRILLLACGPFGLRDYMTILYLNAFGIAIFALLESKFTRISNEYFKY